MGKKIYSASTALEGSEKPFAIVMVEENVGGFYRMNREMTFDTFKEAMTVADEMNKPLGVTPVMAMEIVASSFRAQALENGGRR